MSNVIPLSTAQSEFVRNGAIALKREFENTISEVMGAVSSVTRPPPAMTQFHEELTSFVKALDALGGVEGGINLRFAPILRTIVQVTRRARAQDMEQFRSNVVHPEMIAGLSADLAPLDALVAEPWFADTVAWRVPRLADFLTLQRIKEITPGIESHQPSFDPQSRVLFAKSSVATDLKNMRNECATRDAPLTVAFIDVDDFKAFNERYTEVRVDNDVLPPMTRAIERVVFGHGRAYRYGGDEFVYLLPNCDQRRALELLHDLRERLRTASYPGIEERPTVSCGICVLESDSLLTDLEAVQRATLAKRFAKRKVGKNKVGVFSSGLCREFDLTVAEDRASVSDPAAASR